MKKQVVYIHGGTSFSSQETFLNWLKETDRVPLPSDEHKKYWSSGLAEELGEEYEVFAPSMPNKHNAKYIEWKTWFERYIPHLHDGVILVGWSRGGYFLTKYLIENELPVKIKHLFLVSSLYSLKKIRRDDVEDGLDFEYDTDALESLQKKVEGITIYHSEDDFVVPFAHGEALSEALPEAEFVVYEDKNHFLIEKFPDLIKKIKSL